jgi:flagellar hook-associated protein 3 FlgL
VLGRVTPDMMRRSVLGTINDLTDRITTAQRQVSTGLRISDPSDDPLGAQRVIDLKGSLEGTQQYGRTVDDSNGWLETTDSALGQITDVVHRVHELTVQAASDTTSPQARQSIGLEINQLIEAVKQTANASYQGAFIFSGTATTTQPYQPGAADAYAGDAGQIVRSIGPNVSVAINALGGQVLGAGNAGAPGTGDGKLLATLRDIAAHLNGGTPADATALQTTDLKALDANLDDVVNARSTVGAVMNRMDAAKARLGDVESTTNKVLSETQDADIAKSILDLTNQQNALQAALKTGANLIQPSLLDFLN